MPSTRQFLELFYHDQRAQLFACALAVTRCPDQAEDAVHEAFSRLLNRDIDADDPKAYVFKAVRNSAIDLMRRKPMMNQPIDELEIFDPSPNPCELAVSSEFAQQASEALDQLNVNERETIMQHLYADLTFREIAEISDVPLGTVTAWYRRGIDKLRGILGKE